MAVSGESQAEMLRVVGLFREGGGGGGGGDDSRGKVPEDAVPVAAGGADGDWRSVGLSVRSI